MMTIKELEDKWADIPPYSSGFLLISDDKALSFHIGYCNDCQKCFVVLNTGDIKDIASSKAISAINVDLPDGGKGLRFSLNYESLEDLFVRLCWDLMDASQGGTKPVESLVKRYNNWQRLLAHIDEGKMSVSKEKGLLGELLYLSALMERESEEFALNSWVGPEGSDQDFTFDCGWTEVKATVVSSDSIIISSLEQLDRADTGEIVVYFIDKTSAQNANTICLTEMVQKIQNNISLQLNKDIFECKLAKVGYSKAQVNDSKPTRYVVGGKKKYLVDADFPKLTRNNVQNGVTAAKYELSLSVMEKFRASEE